MSLWVCVDCNTSYAVGLARCPHCQSGEHMDPDAEVIAVAKITRWGGPSHAEASPAEPEVAAEVEPAPDPEPAPESYTLPGY